MRGNLKTILIIFILFLSGIAVVLGIKVTRTYLSGASAGTEPKNVRIQADSGTATISWQSDKEAMGVVEYGTNQASLLLRAIETAQGVSHRLVLSPLKADTTYYFRVRVGDLVYDNNGIPYSFRTKPSSADQSPSPDGGQRGSKLISPTEAPPVSSGAKLTTSCNQADFESLLKKGSYDKSWDFNNDQVIDSRDWLKCLSVNNK